MPICFRAPGVALRIEELLARVEPARAARELVRGERLRLARTFGVGEPWQPGAPVRDLRAAAPPGAAFWLDDAARGRSLVTGREFELELPGLPWPSGSVPVRGGSRFRFERRDTQADRVRVAFACEGEGAQRVLPWCARAGAPAIGDLAHGGSLALPGEPLFAPAGALRVSAAAARALARGHPWLTRDAESEDEGRFGLGALVALRDPAGRALGGARIEGGPQLVARMWQREPDEPASAGLAAKPPSIEERALRALARREKLLGSGETDALRLVHGEADALPGLFADRFGPLLRILVTGRAAIPLWERVVGVLARALERRLGAEPSVVLALQLKPQPAGDLLCVQQVSGPPLPESVVVREGTLAFRIDAGLAEPTRAHPGVGLFPDQRRNRARLATRVHKDGAYLNLFAHTGAFSAAMLAAGAGSVTSVDLSAAYLARLDENLARSGLASDRHRRVKRDVRRFLTELAADVQFDGIVLDPPTAAAAGREFWSARTGLERLAADCFRHLAPGGFLLVTSNDRRARGKLRSHLEAAARAAGIAVRLGAAPPSADYPPLRGFPEGDAFEGVIAERSG
jgi:23S rRNA (cytosine1962-C5)-methyltransferase